MLYMILYYFLVTFGLGALVIRSTPHRSMLGLQLFLGFAALPILIFTLNLVFRLNLETASQIVSLVGIAGVVIWLRDNKANFRATLQHPLWFGMIALTIVFKFFGTQDYSPHSWDEFSHWLTMPKQMFLHKELLSSAFEVTDFASYTPGWPLQLLAYSLAALPEFDVSKVVFLPYFSGFAMILASYDLLKENFDTSKSFASREIIFVLAIAFGLALGNFFTPESVLIENPMVHVLILIFVVLAIALRSTTNTWWIFIGIFLAYAYLLKHTYLTLVPVIALAALIGNRTGLKGLSIKLVCSLAPFLFCFAVWRYEFSSLNLPEVFSPISGKSFEELQKLFVERLYILRKLPRGLIEVVSGLPNASIVFLASFLFSWRLVGKRLYGLIIFFGAFYLACLIWMYFTAFSEYESEQLASLSRYLSIPLSVVLFWGSINFFRWAKEQRVSVLLIFMPLLMVPDLNPKRTSAQMRLLEEGKKLQALLVERKIEDASVIVISQGSNNLDYYITRYVSLGPDRHNFKLASDATSFGPVADNVWRRETTTEQMIAKLEKVDVIWMVATDPWFDEIIKKRVDLKLCTQHIEHYFIFPNSGTWSCERKW